MPTGCLPTQKSHRVNQCDLCFWRALRPCAMACWTSASRRHTALGPKTGKPDNALGRVEGVRASINSGSLRRRKPLRNHSWQLSLSSRNVKDRQQPPPRPPHWHFLAARPPTSTTARERAETADRPHSHFNLAAFSKNEITQKTFRPTFRSPPTFARPPRDLSQARKAAPSSWARRSTAPPPCAPCRVPGPPRRQSRKRERGPETMKGE